MIKARKLRDKLFIITKDKRFEFTMMAVIIFSALVIGIHTFDIDPVVENVLFYLDYVITIIFVIEITVRIAAEKKPLDFFKDGWNVFDFIIVAVSLIPIDNNYANTARLIRIFRMLRLITLLPELKVIIGALFKSAKSIGYVMVLMFIIFYVFAVVGTILFEKVESGLWRDVGIALLTLFRVMTFEDWTDVMYETMEIHPWSWLYYLTFIFLTTFTFLNMIIGIILDTLNEEHKKVEQVRIDEDKEVMLEILEKNKALELKLDRIETLLSKK
ncbi:MAG: ion transporter [Sulfurimonas sp.]|uniref:ion transporter n=1 Tax=Sulfurimonas sp. TaxID=2022749 RepID=UPI0026112BD1|nr:ion transporter [Sulfurimonas sp.]MCW8895035.1 ion transporter [Sulfurimonas sp.]MCW8953633.1 ion transporter [Sulfurimonas sp.]MCW9067346.1 ion transporter [Sulfurimonas sp.]